MKKELPLPIVIKKEFKKGSIVNYPHVISGTFSKVHTLPYPSWKSKIKGDK